MPASSRVAGEQGGDKGARDRLTLLLAAGLTFIYYAFVMARGVDTLFMTTGYGLTFNSMLAHLLSGAFDVDPAAVGEEGFALNGKVYAYFGIVPALLRLPLMMVVDLRVVDVTGLMCVLAIWVGGLFQIATVLAIRRASRASLTQSLAAVALLASIILSGAQVPFLRPSVYQESCSWAVAWAAMFVYWTVRGLIEPSSFTRAIWVGMACAAGLALLTRVTTGLGLYFALMFLLFIRSCQAAPAGNRRWLEIWRQLRARDVLIALSILAGFVVLTGFINWMRWGKPWVFVPLPLQIMNETFPDRLDRLMRLGEFNIRRLPFGLMYYFFPIWPIIGTDGRFLFSDFQDRMLDAAELPPSSFFLSDPLLILFLGIFFAKSRVLGPNRLPAMALLAGLAVPIVLMLLAPSMSFRYRGEFYPALLLGAFLGFFALCRRDRPGSVKPALRNAIFAGCLLGIAMGHVTMGMYRVTDFGPATILLREGRLGAGPFTYYRSALGF